MGSKYTHTCPASSASIREMQVKVPLGVRKFGENRKGCDWDWRGCGEAGQGAESSLSVPLVSDTELPCDPQSRSWVSTRET